MYNSFRWEDGWSGCPSTQLKEHSVMCVWGWKFWDRGFAPGVGVDSAADPGIQRRDEDVSHLHSLGDTCPAVRILDSSALEDLRCIHLKNPEPAPLNA